MSRKTELSTILRSIEKAHEGTESHASAILEAIRREGASTLQEFDVMVQVAYERNGWSQRIGRPQAGDVPAPVVVKVYVSTIRAAYRLGVDVGKAETMQELRNHVRAARAKIGYKSAEKAAHEAPELAGVSIQSPGTLTGALLHDLYAVRVALDEESAATLDQQLHALLKQYIKQAPPALRLVA